MSEEVKKFIFNDEVQNILSEINDNVMDFNILEITGMGTQEIKHSNILGWMFDDSEHNLEYQILDNFLKKVIQNSQNDDLQSYIYLSNKKRDITIYREKDNIDLLIVDEANKIVITIENKIYANERVDGEDGGQLKKYEDIINEKYNNDYQKIFIFLTIKLEKPSKDNSYWLSANHQMITNVVDEILKTKEITTKTKIILESYVDLLKRNGIVADENLEYLCEKIWANKDYSNAIDILLEYRVTDVKRIYEKIVDKLRSDNIEFIDNFLVLNSIKEIYKKFDSKNWEESEKSIFDLQLCYFGGKNDSIWLGYWHPDMLEEDNDDIVEIYKKITNKTKRTKETKIYRINKDSLENKSIDQITEEVVTKIISINQEILNLL